MRNHEQRLPHIASVSKDILTTQSWLVGMGSQFSKAGNLITNEWMSLMDDIVSVCVCACGWTTVLRNLYSGMDDCDYRVAHLDVR